MPGYFAMQGELASFATLRTNQTTSTCMASNFRQTVNTWGTIGFGVLLAIGGGSRLYNHLTRNDVRSTAPAPASVVAPSTSQTALSLSPEEKAEAARIKSANNLAGQMGHEISANTKLFLVGDNFGENKRCAIHVEGQDPKGQLVSAKWDLVVQTGTDAVVWTSNMLGANGSEVRLTLMPSGKRVALDKQVSVDGRGVALDPELLGAMLTAKSLKASSGLLGNTELSNEYDLSAFQRAYKLATAACA